MDLIVSAGPDPADTHAPGSSKSPSTDIEVPNETPNLSVTKYITISDISNKDYANFQILPNNGIAFEGIILRNQLPFDIPVSGTDCMLYTVFKDGIPVSRITINFNECQ